MTFSVAQKKPIIVIFDNNCQCFSIIDRYIYILSEQVQYKIMHCTRATRLSLSTTENLLFFLQHFLPFSQPF